MITIVDCGLGNTGSVLNMIQRVGGEARLSHSAEEIACAEKLILPGVGAFDAGVASLSETGLGDAVKSAVADGAWLLGVCLGMQLLLEESEEGAREGLGLVRGRCLRFDLAGQGLRVPHMGWNTVDVKESSVLFGGEDEERRYYFVHSYYAVCDDPADVAATTTYGHEFVAAIEHDRVLGAQFHPEKSHRFGMALMRRFVEA
jgi:glutamine amidotransferase